MGKMWISFKRRKIYIFLLFLIGIICYVYFVYDINKRFPSPENYVVKEGESFLYQGIYMDVEKHEFLTYSQLNEKYHPVEAGVLEDLFYEKKNGYYLCQYLKIHNTQNEEIDLKSAYDIGNWCYESRKDYNGMTFVGCVMDGELTVEKGGISVQPGESKEVMLCYYIGREGKDIKTVKKENFKIVYSLYPTKNYILVKGD